MSNPLAKKLVELEDRIESLESSVHKTQDSKQYASNHFGKKTKEVLIQEMISILNQADSIKTPKELKNFRKQHVKLLKEIEDHKDFEEIRTKIEEWKNEHRV